MNERAPEDRAAPAIPPTVAGCGVVRALAHSERSDVLLLRPPQGQDRATVAKLFRPEVSRSDIDRELAALGGVADRHSVSLMDVSSAPDGRVAAVLARCERGDLATLLARRASVSVGEAVTILTPLATTLGRLHSAGVAHGGVGPRHVMFDAAGAPVLVGFGAAELFAPGLPEVALGTRVGVVADRRAFVAVAASVLSRVRGAGQVEAMDLIARLDGAQLSAAFDTVIAGLFAFAVGSPVRFEVDADDRASYPTPLRLGLGAPVRVAHASSDREGPEPNAGHGRRSTTVGRTRRSPRGAFAAMLHQYTPEAIRHRLVAGRARLVAGRARPLSTVALGGRRRAVVAGLTVAIATVVALVALPSPAAPNGGAPAVAGDRGASSSGTDAPAAARPSARPSANTATTATDADEAAVLGDDPVAAARVLLALRARCLRDLDADCLAAVSESGSAARRADTAVMSALTTDDGADPMGSIDPAAATLVQDLGGAALVATNAISPRGEWASAPLLVVRSGAGWRIRSYDADPAG